MMHRSQPRLRRWLLWFGVFAAVWGAKLVVIDRYGSDIPKWDQWPAEGEALFLPYQQHRLGGEIFFQPHNEHRIAFTRALALLLFVLNDQWDARLECVANAALHAAIAAAICLWGWSRLEPRHRLAWLAVVVGLTAPPIAWDNVLSGFHSQQYFLVAFSLGTFGLLEAPAGSLRWLLAAACAVCALFSMGSGLLAALAVIAVSLFTCRTVRDSRLVAPTLALGAGVVLLGAALQFSIPTEPALRAGSIGEYFAALVKYFGWPFARYPGHDFPLFFPLYFLPWIPWFWLGLRLRREPRAGPGERAVFAAGLWTLLQFAASAFARGAGAPWPASRYVDNLVIGVLANAFAFFLMLRARTSGPPPRPSLVRLAFVGCALAIAGLGVHTTYQMLYRLPLNRTHMRNYESNIRAYLTGGDPADIIGPGRDVPHTDPAALRRDLDQPGIRAILPVSVQSTTAEGPLSRAADQAARAGFVVFLGGIVMLVAAAMIARPRTAQAP